MSHKSALAHIVRHDDGTSTGVWGPFTLKSAFQPIFTFQNGKLIMTAFEGLIRPFRNEQPVAPSVFFAALPAIDRLQVETVTRTLHLFNAKACLPEHAAIFVNFDPSVFFDRSIADGALQDMRVVLSNAGIDTSRVVCEVTEQKSASQEALYQFVGALRASGFRIAVDDYGSHESDINRIRELRPDIVKFDAQWITRLMETGPGFGLLSAMVEIFAKQGILTVFEGIEEDWQLDLAEKSGASMVQGYVLARPEIVPTSFGTFHRDFVAQRATSPVSAKAKEPDPAIVIVRSAKTFGRRVAH